MKRRVLFLCTGNSGRSQIAKAMLRQLGADEYEVFSAGTQPADTVHPLAVTVMQEIGIDISQQRPKHVNDFLDMRFHRVSTVCDAASEQCPYFPGAERVHWPFPDPAASVGTEAERLRVFRQVRQELKTCLDLWLIIDRRRLDLTPS